MTSLILVSTASFSSSKYETFTANDRVTAIEIKGESEFFYPIRSDEIVIELFYYSLRELFS